MLENQMVVDAHWQWQEEKMEERERQALVEKNQRIEISLTDIVHAIDELRYMVRLLKDDIFKADMLDNKLKIAEDCAERLLSNVQEGVTQE